MYKAITLLFTGLMTAPSSFPYYGSPMDQHGAISMMPEESIVAPSVNLNISILIDLSDRIDPGKYPNPTMEFYQRDTGHIGSIVRAFKHHVAQKRIIQIDDRLSTYIDPLPHEPEIARHLSALRIELNRNTITREVLAQIPIQYAENTAKIYNQAITDNHFIGSDIWRFFKSRVKDYCTRSNAKNIVVILTDGYMYHPRSMASEGGRRMSIGRQTFTELGLNTSDWKTIMERRDFGFFPTGNDLNGTKILLLGLNPNPENPFEEEVLKAYWTQWFTEMGVEESDILIKSSDLPINLNQSIQEFILK